MMNSLKDIFQRCHQRHEKPLRQRKTVVTPAIYKGLLYHFTVYCAHRYPVSLHDLEQADISFMPTGRTSAYDRIPQSFGGDRFLRRQGLEDWEMRQWHASRGIQVYTGIPSEREGAQWHDLHFTYESICAAPDAVLACLETLTSVVANPLLTLTKSGGLRFSCRIPNYLHPKTEEARFYIYKDVPTTEHSYQRDIYLEILGEEGHSPWDNRYEILLGDLLNPPIITKEVLFTSVDSLREELHVPESRQTEHTKLIQQDFIVSTPSLGSYKLDLAKEAFLKHGFSYLRQEDDLHHWTRYVSDGGDTDALLWERDDTVWGRALTPDVGLPTTDTLITDVWDDTGILPPIPVTGLPVSEKMLAVQEGILSPLAIKRPSPVLQSESTETAYETLEENITQVQNALDTDARIIGLTAEVGARNHYEIESHLLKGDAVSFNAKFSVVEEVVQYLESENSPSVARWRSHSFRWDQVKDIPIDVRMANPFQHGNVCEDAERCLSLEAKGVDSSKIICPECPVYTVCQERGYLSQPATLRRAKIQIFGTYDMFLNPNYSAVAEEILEPINDTERLCIIDEVKTGELFLEHDVSKDTLEMWEVSWQGNVLGSFAKALLNALEIGSEPDNILVRRIRTVVQAFQQHEAELIRQMCQVNVQCKVIAQGIVDNETGEELACWTIGFEDGASAYIPLDDTAANRLMAKELPVFQPESFKLDEDTRIPMSVEQAIQLGILDVGTVKKIQKFPRSYQNPDWTLWHQLNRFFAHYTRDTDAPMIWHNNILQFWVPPVLHRRVKQLLIASSVLSDQDFHSIFPNEKIEVTRIRPTAWVEGNQVFQIRAGVPTLKTLLNYDSNWDVTGLSKMGEQFFLGICTEIERDPKVQHAIITYDPIIEQLRGIAEKENVCLLREFKDLKKLDNAFEAAEVVWIVGTPFWQPGITWRRAQILHGNDEEPLCYEAETEFQAYKDKRVQRIYTQTVASLITEIVGRAGLNRWGGKKVVLISSLEMPGITDRPETLLFDWEDFEVADGLNKLAETIAVRQQFETERDNLTSESSRDEVARVLGCSTRQANRMLNKLRGGNIPRVTFREQILSLLADGEKKAADVIAAIEGNPNAIHHELVRLTKTGEIVKVRWGVYALRKTS